MDKHHNNTAMRIRHNTELSHQENRRNFYQQRDRETVVICLGVIFVLLTYVVTYGILLLIS